ncbi:MAG: hypothetical protein BWY04_00794 [candidate division CPR1 bacterium ADurb.Bin160]|uniref:Uncharacterized protein n=1 Tax=candidate division CPR1 bacterium ADurb.Bin160 TaxID=1852826 RepID=A0A1V5ZME2_9BACT|nr:MAG: hypothetical protein BWY04_00794 [candidate division CPR1 bacterium ADurb.Bin160]
MVFFRSEPVIVVEFHKASVWLIFNGIFQSGNIVGIERSKTKSQVQEAVHEELNLYPFTTIIIETSPSSMEQVPLSEYDP